MLNVSIIDNKYVISFKNEIHRLNILISDEVKDILTRFISKPISELVLDLDGIKFIDSTGFAAILSLVNSANENNCKFQFKNVHAEVKELIEVMNLKEAFVICEN